MLEQVQNWVERYLTPQGDVLALAVQVLIFAVVLLITPVFYRFLGRYFDRLMGRLSQYERIRQMPAYEEQFATVRGVLRPLTAWLLALLGVVVLN